MALFIGSTVVVLCMVSLSHTCSWDDLGNDLDPKLLAYAAKRDPYHSFAISGHSLITPLEMLYYAAAGETQRQIAKILELQPGQKVTPKMSDCESNVHIMAHYKEASKLYLGKQYEINVLYEEVLKDVTHSEIGKVDFNNQIAAADTINKWVAKESDNKIDYLVSPFDLDRNTTAVIVNTFVLESQWLTPFNPKNTKWENFYRPDTIYSELLPFMRLTNFFWVQDAKSMDATAVYIPLFPVEAYMVLVLPNQINGLHRVLESLSKDEIIKDHASLSYTALSLPKFQISTHLELTPFFKSLGMVDVFTSKSELPNLTEKERKVTIDKFMQRSYIRINENGVNAATANKNVGDSLLATPNGLPINITLNHPFYYGFTENYKSNKIYFGGVFRG